MQKTANSSWKELVLIQQLTTQTQVFQMKSLTIGRQNDCDIRIADRFGEISREHARLFIHPEGYCSIEDLGSTNKTYVNGKELTAFAPFYLQEGDTILLANKVELDWEIYWKGEETGNGRQTNLLNKQRVSKDENPSRIGHIGNHPTATVLSYSIMGDYIDKVIPIPGLTQHIRLFIQLHVRPVLKMLNLIEQPEETTEANPFGFLGTAMAIYVGALAIGYSMLENMNAESTGSDSNTLFFVYYAIVSLLYAWVANNVFKRFITYRKSFRKFLKLTSLSQGMILIHMAIWYFFLLQFISKGIEEGMIIILVIFLCVQLYFSIVAAMAAQRFWEIPWKKFIPLLFLVGIITGILSSPILLLWMWIQ